MIAEVSVVIVLAAVTYLFYLHVYVAKQVAALKTDVESVAVYQRSNERQLQNLVQDINGNIARIQARLDGLLGPRV